MSDVSRVSVIMCTYNRAQYGWLAEAIASVLGQTFEAWELIVVDDGSTDNTGDVVATFTDSRIHYARQANAGQVSARNRGINIARGEYITFVDDDDRLLPHALAAHAEHLDTNPEAGAVFGGFEILDESGKVRETVPPWSGRLPTRLYKILMGDPSPRTSMTIRRSWLDRAGIFDPAFRTAEDVDLWYRLAAAGCQFHSSGQVDWQIRTHGAGQQTANADAQLRYHLMALDKLFAQEENARELGGKRAEVYALAHLIHAERLYRVKEYERAQQSLRRALEINPGLVERRYERLAGLMAAWFLNRRHLVADFGPESVLANLPPEIDRSMLEEQLAATEAKLRFYTAYGQRDAATVRREWWWLACRDARWLRNRGNWAMLVKAHGAPTEAGA